ncbi:SusC/RagA family TonB-linked outer membrane protein [Flectobacillus rivi]|uniref:TonB-dependent receptor n=1 Tax=Flectobacillus rivi TaxID=2984209 RepID=A0ABT6YWA2_9BACT|nr:TonB-dependent receptor [Flectobacillus rivi]MDI9873165.1 TonB-dependent receptor [Flectobacillus rivi]
MKKLLFFCFLFLSSIWSTLAQEQRTVSGKVTDESGEALPGVTVRVKDVQSGTATNVKGEYAIKVASSGKTLVFSSVGYKPTEVAINGRSTINISLIADNKNLQEVVVIGYGTAKKNEVTSSIASIGEKDIKNLPVPGVDQALQGKVAGVTVTSNGGQPGGGVSVRVRGITSVNGNEPLYVIDGVPILSGRSSVSQDQLGGMAGQSVQSPLAALNSNDIVSIDILKDASAQAIYGALAANGVVLITTKKGKSGEGKISYDVYYGMQEVPRRLKLMDLQQYANYFNSLVPEIRNSGAGNLDTLGEFKNPKVLGRGTDWQNAIFQRGYIRNHQLAFSGGSDKTTYYFSLNNFEQTGTVIGSKFERFALRASIDQQVKSWLKAGVSVNLSRSNQRITLTDGSDAVISVGLYNSPASPVRGFDGQYASVVSIGGSTFGNPNNPVALAEMRNVTAIQTKAFGNIFAELNFTNYLNLRNELNYDFTMSQNSAFQPYVRNDNTGLIILSPSKLIEDRGTSLYWSLKNYLTFNKGFGKHWINAVVGHEVSESNYDQVTASRQNLTLNLQSLNAGEGGTTQSISGGKYPWAMESYFGRVNYTYNNRYSISASLRRDGSASFGPNKRYGYFPAASVGWTVSEETFAKKWDLISYLKLRAGVGAVGNSGVGGNNLYTTNIRLFSTAPYGAGGIPQNVGNPNLAWESVVTYNGGVDLSMLNKRVDVTLDVYKKVSTNMLLQTQLPVSSGLGTAWNDINSPWTNAGKMTNTGIDIGVTTYNIQKNGFSWKTNFVFSHYNNILNELNDASASIRGYKEYGDAVLVTNTMVGHPVGTFYGYVTDGLFRTMEDLNKDGAKQGLDVKPTGTWLGDVRYKDLNGDGVIDSKDVTIIGNPNPDFTYGITNTFNYKGFDFSIFLNGSQGGQILNYTRRLTEGMTNPYWNQLSTVLDRYTSTNTNATLPRYNQWHNNNFRVSDRFVEDGSFLRIQNVSFGYNLPKDLIKKAKLTNARLYVSMQNLYTFTKYTGYDPELGSFNNNIRYMNVDDGHYPNPRTFTIGGNFEF